MLVRLTARSGLTAVGTWALAIGTWAGCISAPNLSSANGSVASPDSGDDSGDDVTTAGDAGTGDEPPPDDPAHATCVAACPTGGTCEGATCVLACPGIATCKQGVTCPPGIPCRVACAGARSCGVVDCGAASQCHVDCNGESACDKVIGAATSTEIVCTGKSACKDARCDGYTCTVQCNGDACKAADVHCCATTSCTVNGVATACR